MSAERATLALALAVAATGCRGVGEVESLLGLWEGSLTCTSEVGGGEFLDYTVEMALDLHTQDVKVYQADLEQVAIYDYDSHHFEDAGQYTLEVVQSRPQGSQPVVMRDGACVSATRTIDDGEPAELDCASAPSAPAGDLRWDGADAFEVSGGDCSGILSR